MVAAGAGMAEASQGPSAMALYNGHQNTDPGGFGKAQQLSDYEMMYRQKMTPPTGGADMSRPAGAPEWYNYSGMAPDKYAVPSELKERMCGV